MFYIGYDEIFYILFSNCNSSFYLGIRFFLRLISNKSLRGKLKEFGMLIKYNSLFVFVFYFVG